MIPFSGWRSRALLILGPTPLENHGGKNAHGEKGECVNAIVVVIKELDYPMPALSSKLEHVFDTSRPPPPGTSIESSTRLHGGCNIHRDKFFGARDGRHEGVSLVLPRVRLGCSFDSMQGSNCDNPGPALANVANGGNDPFQAEKTVPNIFPLSLTLLTTSPRCRTHPAR